MFRFLLAEAAIFQFLALMSTYFTQLGLVTNVQLIEVRSFGFCRLCAPWICFTTYLTTLMFVWLSSTAIFSTFYFKYLSFVSLIISTSHIYKFCIISHIPAFLFIFLEVWMYYELSPTFPKYQLTDLSEYSQVSAKHIQVICQCFPSDDHQFLRFPFHLLVFSKANPSGIEHPNDENVYDEESKSCIGLTIQIMVPIVVYPAAFAIFYHCTYRVNDYSTPSFTKFPNPEVELPHPDLSSFLTIGVPALTDPIVSLYFVTRFRKVIHSWLFQSSSKVVPVSKTF